MKWLALAVMLVATPAASMNCELAGNIQDASETRTFYLQGVYDKTTSIVEKATLRVEIDALVTLRWESILWQKENCRSENGLS